MDLFSDSSAVHKFRSVFRDDGVGLQRKGRERREWIGGRATWHLTEAWEDRARGARREGQAEQERAGRDNKEHNTAQEGYIQEWDKAGRRPREDRTAGWQEEADADRVEQDRRRETCSNSPWENRHNSSLTLLRVRGCLCW